MPAFAIDADDVPIDNEGTSIAGEGFAADHEARRPVSSWDMSRLVVEDDPS